MARSDCGRLPEESWVTMGSISVAFVSLVIQWHGYRSDPGSNLGSKFNSEDRLGSPHAATVYAFDDPRRGEVRRVKRG